jgi:voltage-gated potassium channel
VATARDSRKAERAAPPASTQEPERQVTPALEAADDARRGILAQLEAWLETPMVALGFAWLALLVVELTRGLSPFLEAAATVIWAVFVLDFVIRFLLAPGKLHFLKRNWLTVISLLIPALRVFRVVRLVRALQAARAARGLGLVRVLTSVNRGMGALGASMGRRGFGYVVALTLLVTVAGAAGMYAFERPAAGGDLESYGMALWWTAMVMTTLGSEYWPQTPEGRVLCILLALYAFAVFGYVTATLATFFLGRDAEEQQAQAAKAATTAAMRELREEIAALRAEIQALAAHPTRPERPQRPQAA